MPPDIDFLDAASCVRRAGRKVRKRVINDLGSDASLDDYPICQTAGEPKSFWPARCQVDPIEPA